MSLSMCVKFGTTAGLVCGLTTAAYLAGRTKRANAADHPATFGLGMTSVSSAIAGPFVGAVAGGAGYGINKSVNHLRVAPKATQLVALTIMTSGCAMAGAYHWGRTGI